MLKFKEIRKQNDRTQDEVATALGVSRSTYTNLENGKHFPTPDIIEKFADYFEVSMDAVFGRDNQSSICVDTAHLSAAYNLLNVTGKQLLSDYAKLLCNNPAMIAVKPRAQAT